MKTQVSFGENLKMLRNRKGITQEELAEHLKIARQSISKWEQDLALPSLIFLRPLTKSLDCTLEELLQV